MEGGLPNFRWDIHHSGSYIWPSFHFDSNLPRTSTKFPTFNSHFNGCFYNMGDESQNHKTINDFTKKGLVSVQIVVTQHKSDDQDDDTEGQDTAQHNNRLRTLLHDQLEGPPPRGRDPGAPPRAQRDPPLRLVPRHLVSELFKFTRNPHHIVTTYRYLTDKACPFNIAKRLFLALSSTQVCCHFIVTFVPFLQQTQMQEAFRAMATKVRRAEHWQAQRTSTRSSFSSPSRRTRPSSTSLYRSPSSTTSSTARRTSPASRSSSCCASSTTRTRRRRR